MKKSIIIICFLAFIIFTITPTRTEIKEFPHEMVISNCSGFNEMNATQLPFPINKLQYKFESEHAGVARVQGDGIIIKVIGLRRINADSTCNNMNLSLDHDPKEHKYIFTLQSQLKRSEKLEKPNRQTSVVVAPKNTKVSFVFTAPTVDRSYGRLLFAFESTKQDCLESGGSWHEKFSLTKGILHFCKLS